LQTAQGDTQAKVCKRACFFQRTTEKTKKSFHASQKIKSADTPNLTDKYERTEKTTAAKTDGKNHSCQHRFGVMAADVHNLSLVLLLNFCAKFGLMFPDCRHKRQAVNRYQQAY